MARHAAILCVVGLEREAAIAGPPFAIGAESIPADLSQFQGVISFGLCGALAADLGAGDLIIGEAVMRQGLRLPCDPGWTDALAAALPGARRGLVAASDIIVATAADKAALRLTTGALATDMESHAAAQAAASAGIPFAILRAVSDDAERDLGQAAQAGFNASGKPQIVAVLAALVRRPWELPALIRIALEAEAGLKTLSQARVALEVPPP